MQTTDRTVDGNCFQEHLLSFISTPRPWDFVNAGVLSPESVPVICLLIYSTVIHWAPAVCHRSDGHVTVLILFLPPPCHFLWLGFFLDWLWFALPCGFYKTLRGCSPLTLWLPTCFCASRVCSVPFQDLENDGSYQIVSTTRSVSTALGRLSMTLPQRGRHGAEPFLVPWPFEKLGKAICPLSRKIISQHLCI